jgi:hypothetical protein
VAGGGGELLDQAELEQGRVVLEQRGGVGQIPQPASLTSGT